MDDDNYVDLRYGDERANQEEPAIQLSLRGSIDADDYIETSASNSLPASGGRGVKKRRASDSEDSPEIDPDSGLHGPCIYGRHDPRIYPRERKQKQKKISKGPVNGQPLPCRKSSLATFLVAWC